MEHTVGEELRRATFFGTPKWRPEAPSTSLKRRPPPPKGPLFGMEKKAPGIGKAVANGFRKASRNHPYLRALRPAKNEKQEENLRRKSEHTVGEDAKNIKQCFLEFFRFF